MSTEYHFKRHLVEARTNRFRLGLALMSLAVSAVGIATPALLTRAATSYSAHATVIVTGDYQGSTSATTTQHSFGTCTSAIGQLFTIQAGIYRSCDGVAFGSPNGLYLYVPTAPAGFYVANWRVTGNTTNGSVSCTTSQCYLNYTAGTANLEVDINAITQPTAPTISVGGATATSVLFNWTAGSAGSATFIDYLPYLNGGSNGVTQARSLNWTGLSCGQTVNMKVAIRTTAGNRMSNTVNGSTTACTPVSTPTPVPTVAPAPSSTPIKTPAPAPNPTPKPIVGSNNNPATVPAANIVPKIAPDPNAVPTTPGNFQVQAASENALIKLSWDASTDVNGVQAYKLERSFDQTNWTVVGRDLATPGFLDDTVVFGIHYFYRVSAVSITGKVSDFALGDVTTGAFTPNSLAADSGVYFSADKVARVEVPAGATGADSAVCTVETVTARLGTTDRPVIAGPYSLVCKTSAGELITDFSHPVAWTFDVKAKLKGFEKPSVSSVDSSGGEAQVKNAIYNNKAQTLQFNQTSATTTAVLASKSPGFPINLAAIVAVLLLGGGGVFTLILRKSQKQNYNEYLRRKYYDF